MLQTTNRVFLSQVSFNMVLQRIILICICLNNTTNTKGLSTPCGANITELYSLAATDSK